MDDNTTFAGDDPFMTQKMLDMEWSEEHENILIDWADKAMCYRWLHAKANNKFSKLLKWFSIPVIIISTLTGTANFAQDRVPVNYASLFVMAVGSLNLIAGIISTIQQFLKINELNEAHRVSSIAWDKFYRNIKIELAKNPKERILVGQMIKMCKEEFDRLMETSPVIQNDIINNFTETFKNTKTFIAIKKPEICDELISTGAYRYVSKETKLEKNTKIQHVLRKANEMKKHRNIVNEFKNKFIEAQGREPTRDEVYDSLKHHELFIGNNLYKLNQTLDGFYSSIELPSQIGNIIT